MCINYGGIIPGARNDFYLHQSGNLCKLLACRSRNVDGSYSISHPQILCDGGYRGIEASYPEAVLPIRRLPHQHLSDEHKEFNRKLSQDGVIVERFFGRLKGYWALMQNPYRSDRNTADTLARRCVCLTNLKIRDEPLYSIEHIYDPDHVEEEENEESSLLNTNSSICTNSQSCINTSSEVNTCEDTFDGSLPTKSLPPTPSPVIKPSSIRGRRKNKGK